MRSIKAKDYFTFTLLLLFILLFNSFSEDTKWYRNDISSMAELTISESTFTIIAGYNGNHGEASGNIIKLNDTVCYAYLTDTETDQKSLFVFEFNESNIKVSVFGDQFNAGGFVYYDGIYDKNEISEQEYQKQYLERILNNHYEISKIQSILKNDLSYFIECFKRTSMYREPDQNIQYSIEGDLPGDSNSEKGLLLITKKSIEIIFLDSRNDEWVYQYYTNQKRTSKMSNILVQWLNDNKQYNIIAHYE